MENEMLCGAMEDYIMGMPDGEQDLFREAVRRLRIGGGHVADRIVDLAGKLGKIQELAIHLTNENEKLKAALKAGHRELHVHYDLEEEGCGAVLQTGMVKFEVSAFALAEILEAKRDGRLQILPKEEENHEI